MNNNFVEDARAALSNIRDLLPLIPELDSLEQEQLDRIDAAWLRHYETHLALRAQLPVSELKRYIEFTPRGYVARAHNEEISFAELNTLFNISAVYNVEPALVLHSTESFSYADFKKAAVTLANNRSFKS